MKKISLLIFFLLLFITPAESVGYGQDNRETAYDLLKNSEKYFPRLLIDNKYNENSGWDVYEEISLGTVIDRIRNGVLTTTIFSPDPTGNAGISAFNADTYYGTLTDFHLHTESTLTAAFPENLGTCFIQYTNLATAGENARQAVTVYIGDRVEHYESYSGNRVFVPLADLSADYEIGRRFVVDMIRLNGTGYVFVDGIFLAEIQDGIQENLSWMMGAGTLEGGEQATCVFDNLWVRRK